MCTIHQLFSDSLIACESFPRRNSLVRSATVVELAEHCKVRIQVRRTRSVGPVSNRIISDDDDEEGSGSRLGGVAGPPARVPLNLWSSFKPVVLPSTASCPAAAGSAAQLENNETYEQGDEQLITSPGDDIDPATSDGEEEDGSLGLSASVLDAINNYIQAVPLPWKVKSILSGLMEFLPRYSHGMLATHLITYLKRAKSAADIIVHTSSNRAPIRCKGYDLIPLDGRSSALLRVSGADTAECLE